MKCTVNLQNAIKMENSKDKRKEYTVEGWPNFVFYGGVGAVVSDENFRLWKEGKFDPFSQDEKDKIDEALTEVSGRISKEINRRILERMGELGWKFSSDWKEGIILTKNDTQP